MENFSQLTISLLLFATHTNQFGVVRVDPVLINIAFRYLQRSGEDLTFFEARWRSFISITNRRLRDITGLSYSLIHGMI